MTQAQLKAKWSISVLQQQTVPWSLITLSLSEEQLEVWLMEQLPLHAVVRYCKIFRVKFATFLNEEFSNVIAELDWHKIKLSIDFKLSDLCLRNIGGLNNRITPFAFRCQLLQWLCAQNYTIVHVEYTIIKCFY